MRSVCRTVQKIKRKLKAFENFWVGSKWGFVENEARYSEPPVSQFLAEVRVSRTHRRPLRTTAGFEDREDHRSLSTSNTATASAV
jgi:hypothetical protein